MIEWATTQIAGLDSRERGMSQGNPDLLRVAVDKIGIGEVRRLFEDGISLEEIANLPGDRYPTVNPGLEPPEEYAPTLTTLRACDVEIRPVRWLWRDVIVRGALNSVQGIAGIGKTYLICAIAAAVSSGGAVQSVNGDMERVSGGQVLFLSGDDDPETTLVPRMKELGADLSSIHFAPNSLVPSIGSPEFEGLFVIAKPNLCILDTLQHFLPARVDLNSANVVTNTLQPLRQLAEEYSCAVVIVQHISKFAASGGGGQSVNFGIGSSAVNGLFRSVWTLGRLKGDDGKPGIIRALAPTKTNLVAGDPPAILFELSAEKGFVWAGIDQDLTAEDLYNPSNKKDRATPARDDCATYLSALLEAGPIPASAAMEASKDNGFSEATINRSKKTAGIVTFKEKGNFGRWMWASQGYQGESLKKRDNIDYLENVHTEDSQHYQDSHVIQGGPLDNLVGSTPPDDDLPWLDTEGENGR
ncbi:MAG: AAA family ATPase [Oscillospiraceae bacterium]|jgi:hypothetical protein|nr:AAA family ATPase [Oscillospiraceae bacterium]